MGTRVGTEERVDRREPLLNAAGLRCPRCKRRFRLNAFDWFDRIEEYESETNTICKCPHCRWIFSPGPSDAELAAMLQAMLLRDQGALTHAA